MQYSARVLCPFGRSLQNLATAQKIVVLQRAAAKDRSWPNSKEMLSIDRVSWLTKELSRNSGTGNAAWIIESGISLAVDYASVSFW